MTEKKMRNNQYIKYTYLIFDQQSSQIVFLHLIITHYSTKIIKFLRSLYFVHKKKKYMKNKRTDTTSPSKWFSVHIFKMNKKKKISWDYLCLSFTLWFGMSKTLETCILYVKRKLFKLVFGLDISHSTTHETL